MKKTLLVMAVSSLLVACGSGSSGGGSSDEMTSVPYSTRKGTMQQYISSSGKIKGNIVYNKNLSQVAKTLTIADDAKSVMLDGKKIDLVENENVEYISNNVGIIFLEYPNKEGIQFIGGRPTQQMPESGKARYDIGKNNYLDVTFAGKDKGVKGKIDDFDFKAKLFGNTFEGTENLPSKTRKNRRYETHLRGGFYGQDAMETAGLWGVKFIDDGKVVKGMGGIFYGEKE